MFFEKSSVSLGINIIKMYYLNRYTIYLYSPEVGELFTQVSCILLKAIKGLELHLQAADTVHLGCVTGWRGHQS